MIYLIVAMFVGMTTWHLFIELTKQEKVAVKYMALQQGIPVKQWVRDTILAAIYPTTIEEPNYTTKEVEYGTVTKDSFSPGHIDE